MKRTTILLIEIQFLFYWLDAAYKSKLTRNI
jgi:hypothetical protein